MEMRRTPFVFEGVTYSLCGDFGALVKAEAHFNLTGHDVDLVRAIWTTRDAESCLLALRQILPCALHAFHPKLGFEGVQAMIDRMVAIDDSSFVRAVGQMWPAVTQETEEANRHLSFDLNDLAAANEFFGGQAGLSLLCVEGPVTLDLVCRVFPCAVHRFRPELNLRQARQLMTLQSVFLIVGALAQVGQAPLELQEKFIERVLGAASDEQKQDLAFRILAKRLTPDAAQA